MRRSGFVFLASIQILTIPRLAAAQEQPPPLTAVLSSAVAEESLRATGGAIERVVRARLDALDVVEVAGTPALNLADLQLAVGCMGETPECLAAVAGQLEVEALILPRVDRAGSEVVVSVTFFDRRGTTRTAQAVRRASGARAEEELVDGMDALVRELFGLPPAPADHEGVGERPVIVDGGGGGVPVLPIIALAAGGVALGLGAMFGIMAGGSEDEYAEAPTGTRLEVDAALEIRDRAETQATLANVMFVAGGVLVAAGAVLFVLTGGGGDAEATPRRAWIAPSVTPSGTSLVVGGTFGETW